MTGSTVVGVVPARIGSTRFPGKVLQVVAGKPLVVHVLERLSAASRVDRVVVATDSADVEREVAKHGARVVMVTEPCATGSDRVARALEGDSFDIAVNLQADQPLIDPTDIDRVIETLEREPSLSLTTLAYRDSDPEEFSNRDVVKVVADEAGHVLYFSRAPIPSIDETAQGKLLFLHHVGIYCFRRGSLARFAGLPRGDLEKRESLEQLRALEAGMEIGLVITEHAIPDVDRPSDLDRLSRFFEER